MSGGAFKGLAFPVTAMTGTNVDPVFGDGEFTRRSDSWTRLFAQDPWGDNDQLLFYARMLTEDTQSAPADVLGVLPNSYQYLYDATNGQRMTFSYRSPATAQDM